jgi:dienelactone hydrolase
MKKMWILLFVMLFTVGLVACEPAAEDDGSVSDDDNLSDSGFERGPDPTVASLEANLGHFDYDTENVSSFLQGFGGGRLYYPVNTTEGPFGAIAVAPGYIETESAVDWWGSRLASNGFVVIVISTSTLMDQPAQRADQLMSALGEIEDRNSDRSSGIYGLVDTDRMGVMGHSMGGGGTLVAAEDNPRLKAAIPLAPWNSYEVSYSRMQVPTLVVGCEDDAIAPVSLHAKPFYNSLPSTISKAYLEFEGDDHFCVINGNSNYKLLGKYGVAWMKRFIDEDTRYSPYLCGAPHEEDLDGGGWWSSSDISDYRDNCPYE